MAVEITLAKGAVFCYYIQKSNANMKLPHEMRARNEYQEV